jgi:plasmid stabilization system protein ParE
VNIFWTSLTAERLENIFEYISKDNSIAAYKMIDKIFKKKERKGKQERLL